MADDGRPAPAADPAAPPSRRARRGPLDPPPGPSPGFLAALGVVAAAGALVALDRAGAPGPVTVSRMDPPPADAGPSAAALDREVRLLLPALARLHDPDAGVRREAVGVVERVAGDPSPTRRRALARALAAIGARAGEMPLRALTADPDRAVRLEARRAVLAGPARRRGGEEER